MSDPNDALNHALHSTDTTAIPIAPELLGEAVAAVHAHNDATAHHNEISTTVHQDDHEHAQHHEHDNGVGADIELPDSELEKEWASHFMQGDDYYAASPQVTQDRGNQSGNHGGSLAEYATQSANMGVGVGVGNLGTDNGTLHLGGSSGVKRSRSPVGVEGNIDAPHLHPLQHGIGVGVGVGAPSDNLLPDLVDSDHNMPETVPIDQDQEQDQDHSTDNPRPVKRGKRGPRQKPPIQYWEDPSIKHLRLPATYEGRAIEYSRDANGEEGPVFVHPANGTVQACIRCHTIKRKCDALEFDNNMQIWTRPKCTGCEKGGLSCVFELAAASSGDIARLSQSLDVANRRIHQLEVEQAAMQNQ